MLTKTQPEPPPAAPVAPTAPNAPIENDLADDESRPIYQSLAMTDELREALFPTTPRMVSAVFDRTAAPEKPAAPPAYAPPPHRESAFPIV